MTHTIFAVFCLGEEHARNVLEGAICVHCEFFLYEKALLSSVSLFEGGGAAVCFPSRPMVAEAQRGLNSWGSQVELADELERVFPSRARRPRTRVSGWMMMMQSR